MATKQEVADYINANISSEWTADDEAKIDTVLGVDIFPIIHVKTQEKIYVSLEDIK